MTAMFFHQPSRLVGALNKAQKILDVILHIGAHRTATTSFQHYMRENSSYFARKGIGFWGPARLRKGLLTGVIPRPLDHEPQKQFLRAKGRIALQLDRSEKSGLTQLIVSEENLLGTLRDNLRSGALYPAAGERIARFMAAFGPRVRGVSLTIRSLDKYWTSALSLSMTRGVSLPSPAKLGDISSATRSWSDVVTDVAAAVPNVPLRVVTFEATAGAADQTFAAVTGHNAPNLGHLPWRNSQPTPCELLELPLGLEQRNRLKGLCSGNRFTPFSETEAAALRERYQDDIHWLASGAGGLAEFQTFPSTGTAGQTLRDGAMTRGHDHDTQRRMAQNS